MALIQCENRSIYYQLHGEENGMPLIILNGIMMSCVSWLPLVPKLARGRKVILMDFFDQGRSDRREQDYDQSIQVKAVKALMDGLKLGQADLLGISYGGEVAMQFALEYPRSVNKLLLFNTTSHTSPWLRDIGRGWVKVAESRDPEAFYHATIPIIYSPLFYNRNIHWMEQRKKLLLTVFNEDFLTAMERLTRSAESHDIRHRLDQIQADTLVVGSEFDFVTPCFEQEFIQSKIPKCKYITLKDCGHASMYEKPNEFISIAAGFLNLDEDINLIT